MIAVSAPHTDRGWVYYWEPWDRSGASVENTPRYAYMVGHWAGIWQWDWDDYPSRPLPSADHLQLHRETLADDWEATAATRTETFGYEGLDPRTASAIAFAHGYAAGTARRRTADIYAVEENAT